MLVRAFPLTNAGGLANEKAMAWEQKRDKTCNGRGQAAHGTF